MMIEYNKTRFLFIAIFAFAISATVNEVHPDSHLNSQILLINPSNEITDYSDPGIEGTLAQYMAAAKNENLTVHFPARNIAYQFKRTSSIPGNIGVIIDCGAVIDTTYSISNDTSYAWVTLPHGVYRLEKPIPEPDAVVENRTALRKVANATEIRAAGEWSWITGVLYVHTASGACPGSMLGGSLDIRVRLEIAKLVSAPETTWITPNSSVLFKGGAVKEVYPEWWGANSDDAADDTAPIQAAMDSIQRGRIAFRSGTYCHTGLRGKSYITLIGTNRSASILDNRHPTNHSLSIASCISPQIENLTFKSSARSTGYGIYGASEANEPARYAKFRNVVITGHKGGIYLQNPLDCTVQDCYVSGQGKDIEHGIGIALVKGTTVTISDTYVTKFWHDIETSTQGYAFIRPVCENAAIGIKSYSRGVIIEPYFSAIDDHDLSLLNNGVLLIGYIQSASNKIYYEDKVVMRRTTIVPDTQDTPVQIWGRKIMYGETPPSMGDWNSGDLCFNTRETSPLLWQCTKGGAAPVWSQVGAGVQYAKSSKPLMCGQTTEETAISSAKILAGTLGGGFYDGGGVQVIAHGTITGSLGVKSLCLKVGNSVLKLFPEGNVQGGWILYAWIMNSRDQYHQVYNLSLFLGGEQFIGTGELVTDTSRDFELKIVGQHSNPADDVRVDFWLVQRF